MAFRWIYVSIFFLAEIYWARPECTNVVKNLVQCMTASSVIDIVCPANHYVVVQKASTNRLPVGNCPTQHDTSSACTEEDIAAPFIADCAKQSNCSYTPTSPAQSPCGGSTGELYAHVEYKCDPVHNLNISARAIGICHAYSWTGALSHIDSHPLGLLGYTINQTDCNCLITVPQDVQISVNTLVFEKRGIPRSQDCQQRVRFVGGNVTHELCHPGDGIKLGCQDQETNYRVSYVTDDSSINVIFVIYISVAHTSEFTIRCGHPKLDTTPAPQPTTAPPSPTTSTELVSQAPSVPSPSSPQTSLSGGIVTLPPGRATTDVVLGGGTGSGGSATADPTGATGQETDMTTIIIAVCSAVGVLLLVFVIILVVFRYRRDKERKKQAGVVRKAARDSDSESQFTFVTEVYVDGDTKSKLVVGNPMNKNTPAPYRQL